MDNKNLVVPYNFIPREYQLPLFQALDGIQGRPETKKKRAFLKWPRRAGKDKTCFAYMAKEMIRQKGVYYYFFPTYAQGRKALWEFIDKDGFKVLDHLPKELVKGKPNNQEMKIETTNGSIFRIVGTEDIDKIVGTSPLGCVFSEYALQDPKAWTYIRPILLENNGWAIFNGTPRGQNHMYKLDNMIKTNPLWYYSTIQTLWKDQPNYVELVTQAQLNEERKSGMEEDMIEQEYGVSYSAGVKGAYYSDQVKRAYAEGRIGSFIYDNHSCVDTYWDLGRNDSTAIWFGQTIGNKTVWVDYIEDNGSKIRKSYRKRDFCRYYSS